jgi:hypothetical protein
MIEISGGACHHVLKSLDLFRSQRLGEDKRRRAAGKEQSCIFFDILAEPTSALPLILP